MCELFEDFTEYTSEDCQTQCAGQDPNCLLDCVHSQINNTNTDISGFYNSNNTPNFNFVTNTEGNECLITEDKDQLVNTLSDVKSLLNQSNLSLNQYKERLQALKDNEQNNLESSFGELKNLYYKNHGQSTSERVTYMDSLDTFSKKLKSLTGFVIFNLFLVLIVFWMFRMSDAKDTSIFSKIIKTLQKPVTATI